MPDHNLLHALEGVAPKPFHAKAARDSQRELEQILKAHEALRLVLKAHEHAQRFLVSVFSLSPYLKDLALKNPAVLYRLLTEPLLPLLEGLIVETRLSWQEAEAIASEQGLMRALRRAKADMALMLGLCDLARALPPQQTTLWLSRFAEAAISASIDHLLALAGEQGKIHIRAQQTPSKDSGLIVLGMGKLGAGELNYSSDIDLVVFFQPDSGLFADPDEAGEIYARMMRRLIRILQERTGDGYVFRTDLRLRPDPGATPLALPVEAALIYYEGRGQNWERAAFIKARPVAGDMKAGQAFLQDMQPFIFRRYLDYAAIADIHSIKRQIHSYKGHGEIKVKGHNVKLGRGGIREIEFFAQTQQLIAGGRMPQLRQRRTDDALDALAKAGWIDEVCADELQNAYWFLRDVEHRIQMVLDEQSHVLGTSQAELNRIAFMMGFETASAFSSRLLVHLSAVERRYGQLFEQEIPLSLDGNLVFTGQKDDPQTLETLARLGFARPADISRALRTWHSGRYRATQSAQARERLTELCPLLLQSFGKHRHGDEALMCFDRFLSGLPAGIQLFSLLARNPMLLDLIVEIMTTAPRLASAIASRPHVFDALLAPGLLVAQSEGETALHARLANFLIGAGAYEEKLDRLRIFADETRFFIGIRLLMGTLSGEEAGFALSHLADLVLCTTLAVVRTAFEAQHGVISGAQVALIGLGKLGSREMTAGSDLDLILIYDYDDACAASDGEKPLDPMRYFTRLTQRLMAALSAPTAEGVLYAVDMRLRPSGNKGPVATRLSAFTRYQNEEAWTWEHMALTRARLIAGDDALMEKTQAVIGAVLAKQRAQDKLVRDVRDMRALVDKEKPPKGPWDLKLMPGGLVDIEFLAQYFRLRAGKNAPLGLTTREALTHFGHEYMRGQERETVLHALTLYQNLSQLIRTCLGDDEAVEDQAPGFLERLARAAHCPDIRHLQSEVADTAKAVRKIFHRLMHGGDLG